MRDEIEERGAGNEAERICPDELSQSKLTYLCRLSYVGASSILWSSFG